MSPNPHLRSMMLSFGVVFFIRLLVLRTRFDFLPRTIRHWTAFLLPPSFCLGPLFARVGVHRTFFFFFIFLSIDLSPPPEPLSSFCQDRFPTKRLIFPSVSGGLFIVLSNISSDPSPHSVASLSGNDSRLQGSRPVFSANSTVQGPPFSKCTYSNPIPLRGSAPNWLTAVRRPKASFAPDLRLAEFGSPHVSFSPVPFVGTFGLTPPDFAFYENPVPFCLGNPFFLFFVFENVLRLE